MSGIHLCGGSNWAKRSGTTQPQGLILSFLQLIKNSLFGPNSVLVKHLSLNHPKCLLLKLFCRSKHLYVDIFYAKLSPSLFLYIFLVCSHSSWLLPGTCVQKLVSLPASARVGMTKNAEDLKVPHGWHISISLPNSTFFIKTMVYLHPQKLKSIFRELLTSHRDKNLWLELPSYTGSGLES